MHFDEILHHSWSKKDATRFSSPSDCPYPIQIQHASFKIRPTSLTHITYYQTNPWSSAEENVMTRREDAPGTIPIRHLHRQRTRWPMPEEVMGWGFSGQPFLFGSAHLYTGYINGHD